MRREGRRKYWTGEASKLPVRRHKIYCIIEDVFECHSSVKLMRSDGEALLAVP